MLLKSAALEENLGRKEYSLRLNDAHFKGRMIVSHKRIFTLVNFLCPIEFLSLQ